MPEYFVANRCSHLRVTALSTGEILRVEIDALGLLGVRSAGAVGGRTTLEQRAPAPRAREQRVALRAARRRHRGRALPHGGRLRGRGAAALPPRGAARPREVARAQVLAPPCLPKGAKSDFLAGKMWPLRLPEGAKWEPTRNKASKKYPKLSYGRYSEPESMNH